MIILIKKGGKKVDINDRGVLVAAHRGTCGGNVIQNTILAYEAALLHGADMLEVDVIMSTDGYFYAFHNGQEPLVLHMHKDIRTMSAKEIEALHCVNLSGHKVNQRLERLEVILERFRGRCFINIDRSWFYWQETIDFLDSMQMQDQILLKSPVERELLTVLAKSGSNLMYMPIVNSVEEWGIVQEYEVNLAAAELIFEDLNSPLITPEFIGGLHDRNILAWVNAITLDDTHILSGLLDDNNAIKYGFDVAWGKLVEMGFDIIQTDWPALLKNYLSGGEN